VIVIKIGGAFMILFGIYYIYESQIIRGKRMGVFEAEIIDEAEDELYDNTGGIKTRFFKVYRYEENGEGEVVKSKRPMMKITDTVGKRVVITVDKKNRTAVERKDTIMFFLYGVAMIAIGAFVLCTALTVGGV
jgi:hypothetical protein